MKLTPEETTIWQFQDTMSYAQLSRLLGLPVPAIKTKYERLHMLFTNGEELKGIKNITCHSTAYVKAEKFYEEAKRNEYAGQRDGRKTGK